MSLLVAPVMDGRVGTPSPFDLGSGGFTSWRLALELVELRAHDLLWLPYGLVAT